MWWIARIFGERMRIEEDGSIVTMYLWRGIYYVTDIEDKDHEYDSSINSTSDR